MVTASIRGLTSERSSHTIGCHRLQESAHALGDVITHQSDALQSVDPLVCGVVDHPRLDRDPHALDGVDSGFVPEHDDAVRGGEHARFEPDRHLVGHVRAQFGDRNRGQVVHLCVRVGAR